MSSSAGVVGLGTIGGRVVARLLGAGRPPTVYDIRPEAAAELSGVSRVAGSPAEVARAADVVMVAVLDAAQAEAVISGPSGLTAAGRDGLIVVLLSTISVADVRRLAQSAAEGGAHLLDCGVTSPNIDQRARDQGLVALLGGDDATVARAMPVLTDWALHVEHCGPLGAGMAAKLARNAITYGCWRVVAEATALAEGANVDMRRLIAAIDVSDPNGSMPFRVSRLQTMEIDDADRRRMLSEIAYFIDKDLAAAQDLARELGVDAPVVDMTRERRAETLGLES